MQAKRRGGRPLECGAGVPPLARFDGRRSGPDRSSPSERTARSSAPPHSFPATKADAALLGARRPAIVRRVRRLAIALFALLGFAAAVALALPALLGGADATLPTPPAQAVAIGDGLSLNTLDLAGPGEPIVLVHGLPSNLGDWSDVPQRLQAAGHRVVAYDRIGYGHSSRVGAAGDAYTLESNARQLLALLDALATPRAALVGWSYGGGIVQRLAMDHPERVSRLVLLSSVGPLSATDPGDDPLEKLAHSPLGPPLFRWVVAIPPLAGPVVADALAAAFSGPERVPAGWTERTRAQLAMPGTVDAWIAEGRNGGYDALRPEAISAPTLVLHGSDDLAVAVDVGLDLSERLPNAELNVVDGGSHMLPATHPDRLAQRIHEWVSQR